MNISFNNENKIWELGTVSSWVLVVTQHHILNDKDFNESNLPK
jgi:hypothetical protein